MGQKVNPHGMRVGMIKDWNSKWYAEADFSDNLVEDYNIRKLKKKRSYTVLVYLRSISSVHQTVLRLLSSLLSRVL